MSCARVVRPPRPMPPPHRSAAVGPSAGMCKVRPCVGRCSLRWRAPCAAAPARASVRSFNKLAGLYRRALAPGRRGVSVPEVFQMLWRLAKGCMFANAVCGPKPKLSRLPDWEVRNDGDGRRARCVCNEGERVRAGVPSPARARAGGAVASAVTVTSRWRSVCAGVVVDAIRDCRDGRCSKAQESCSAHLAISIRWPSRVSGPAARVQPDGRALAACWPISCMSRGTGLRCASGRAALQEKQNGGRT